MKARNKNPGIILEIILGILVNVFPVFGQEKLSSSEFIEEISRDKLILKSGKYLDLDLEDKTNLLRVISSTEFGFDDLLKDEKMSNKLKHIIIQTDNVLDIGFFDAVIKARVHQYGFQGDPFWAYNNFYGRANGVLLFASDLEYSLNQSENLWEFTRFFLSQLAISSVVEHLGYWIYTNSSIPIIKNSDEIGWRGVTYPRDKSGNHNDVPWMKETPSGLSNRIFFPEDSKGTVRKEAVFLTLPFVYAFAYFITPDKPFVKSNKFTKFQYVFYFDSYDYNNKTGLWGGAYLGLKYDLKNFSTSFYSSKELDARGRFSYENKFFGISTTLGTNNKGNFNIYGYSVTLKKKFGYFSFSYRKNSFSPFILSSSLVF